MPDPVLSTGLNASSTRLGGGGTASTGVAPPRPAGEVSPASAGPRDVRVFIADDHRVYRDGIAHAVQGRTGLSLVGVAGDGQAALTAICHLRPDVAVLDINMPALTGIEVCAGILRSRCSTRVLLLSADASPAAVYRACIGGAAGYLGKGTSRDAICSAIESIARGWDVWE